MSTKSVYYPVVKYSMDQRYLGLLATLVDKEIIISPRVGVDFYISYEKKDKSSHVIAIDPDPIYTKIEKLLVSTSKMGASFGHQDYKLYGFFSAENKPYFYDLKINDNFFSWEDFVVEMSKYDLPILKTFWRGITTSLDDVRENILKRTGKEEKYFIFKTVNEDSDITYSGGDRIEKKSEKKTEETVEVENSSTLNLPEVVGPEQNDILREFNDALSDDEFANLMGGAGIFDDTDLTMHSVNLEIVNGKHTLKANTEIEEVSELEPFLVYTLINESGEIDEEALDAFFAFYTNEQHTVKVVDELQRDNIEINESNRTLIEEYFSEAVVKEIILDAYSTSENYIQLDRAAFTQEIKKAVRDKVSNVVTYLLSNVSSATIEEDKRDYISIDRNTIKEAYNYIISEINTLEGYEDYFLYKNITETKKMLIYCKKDMASRIVEQLYSLDEESLIGKSCILEVEGIIDPYITSLVSKINVMRTVRRY